MHMFFTTPSAWCIRKLLAVGLCLLSQMAMADLMLYPTRVVFEREQRAAQVELVNRGTAPETYRIHLVNRRMGESGEFNAVDVPAAGEQFADAMLRYSPRQVTILPGGSQTVRLMLRPPADLADGEYRSHLTFERVPDTVDANSVEPQGPGDGKKVGVVLSALVGACIPVIVRRGDTSVRVSLSDLTLQAANAGEQPLSFTIRREGNRSVYGDLQVRFTSKSGETLDLARANGVAVYVPNAVRRVQLPLHAPIPAGGGSGGVLSVVFRERAEAGGRVLAETSMTLP
jgi:fimbrial chaperone protein